MVWILQTSMKTPTFIFLCLSKEKRDKKKKHPAYQTFYLLPLKYLIKTKLICSNSAFIDNIFSKQLEKSHMMGKIQTYFQRKHVVFFLELSVLIEKSLAQTEKSCIKLSFFPEIGKKRLSLRGIFMLLQTKQSAFKHFESTRIF